MKKALAVLAVIALIGLSITLVAARAPLPEGVSRKIKTMTAGESGGSVQASTEAASPSTIETTASPSPSMALPAETQVQPIVPINCHPTRQNPRFRCIPRDGNGNIGQLGNVLPPEYPNLPVGATY